MEVKVNVDYEQLMSLIRHLSPVQKAKIIAELSDPLIQPKENRSKTDLQNLLLSGPVMNEGQEKEFNELRKRFKKWRTN